MFGIVMEGHMARNTRSLRKVLHVQCTVLEILSSEDLNPNKNFLIIDVMIAHKCNHNTVIATGDITSLVFFLCKTEGLMRGSGLDRAHSNIRLTNLYITLTINDNHISQ